MARKKSKTKRAAKKYTAEEILDLWTTAAKAGLGADKHFARSIPENVNAKLLAKIQERLDAGDDFGKDKKKTNTVAKDLGRICRMFTTGRTVDLDTFQLVFEFVKDNHPVCPVGGGGGAWCEI
jgi:hypothetical protein